MRDLLTETLSGDMISAQLLYLLLLPFVVLGFGVVLLFRSWRRKSASTDSSVAQQLTSENIGQLERFAQLRSDGAISDDDYEEIKRTILSHKREPSNGKYRMLGSAMIALGATAFLAIGFIVLIQSDENGSASGGGSSATSPNVAPEAPTTVAPTSTTRPTTAATTTTPLTQLEDWFALHSASIQPMGAAQEAFEGAIMQQASDEVVGRASIELYNALIGVPTMHSALPVSREWNAWLNAAISVADRISDGYLNRDTESMYIAMFEWSDVQRLYRQLFDAMESIYEQYS